MLMQKALTPTAVGCCRLRLVQGLCSGSHQFWAWMFEVNAGKREIRKLHMIANELRVVPGNMLSTCVYVSSFKSAGTSHSPSSLPPKQTSWPSVLTAQVWNKPAETARTGPKSLGTSHRPYALPPKQTS